MPKKLTGGDVKLYGKSAFTFGDKVDRKMMKKVGDKLEDKEFELREHHVPVIIRTGTGGGFSAAWGGISTSNTTSLEVEIDGVDFKGAIVQVPYNRFTDIQDQVTTLWEQHPIKKLGKAAKTNKLLKGLGEIVAPAAVASTMFMPDLRHIFSLADGSQVAEFVPDIIIGTIPFYSAQRIERGISDRILKYRAIGDVFLAHQKGSRDTLRVDLTLFGDLRYLKLYTLAALQTYGETKLKSIEELKAMEGGELTASMKDKNYESHNVFPIITQSEILLNMYLQTIEWHHSIEEGGYNTIKVHLLFRKHVEPKGYKILEGEDGPYPDVVAKTPIEADRIENCVDTIWKVIQTYGDVFVFELFGDTEINLNQPKMSESVYGFLADEIGQDWFSGIMGIEYNVGGGLFR